MNLRINSIDHVALAVRDLEAAVDLFTNVLGFELLRRRTIKGTHTGMISAEVAYEQIRFVLCQGTDPASQVSRLIENQGPGIAHIALSVDDVDEAEQTLGERGMTFDTTIIRGPGLTQLFSSRDPNSGMSFEFIQRSGEGEFLEQNVNELFAQLERSGSY